MINIAKRLKDAPKGMKLYSPLFGEVELAGVNNACTEIRVIYKEDFPKDFLSDGRYLDFPEAECLLFPSKDRRTWRGWKLPTKPRFKVHDWIIFNKAFTIPIQVIDIKEKDNIYVCRTMYGYCGNYSITEIDRKYHLWSIEDANDGDILVLNGKPFIYSHNKYGKNYCYIDDCGQFRVNFNLVLEGNCVCPATKQEHDLLFTKMREVGYEWDEKKKELRKIKPHYDIANFKPKQWVLVRDDDEWEWALTRFSHLSKGSASLFVCINGASFQQCIPLDGNEELLGTTNMPDEEYINW